MTESEWLSCTTKPKAMLAHATRKASGRKLQLLACAVCRLVWDAVPEPACKAAVEAAERLADGLIDAGEYQRTAQQAREEQAALHLQLTTTLYQLLGSRGRYGGTYQVRFDELDAANVVLATVADDLRRGLRVAFDTVTELAVRGAPDERGRSAARTTVRAEQCRLFREVLGNPFRQYASLPSYAGGGVLAPDGTAFPVSQTARRIAEGVVADGAFDRLPVLADALEDGGCGDPDLLAHLRHGTGHVRGCWALDVVLGRS